MSDEEAMLIEKNSDPAYGVMMRVEASSGGDIERAWKVANHVAAKSLQRAHERYGKS